MDPEIKNAIIKSARITTADHGILSAWLDLDYGGSGQSFGGYALYLSSEFNHHTMESSAGHFIWRVLKVAGVTSWDDLPGKTIRVKADHSRVHGIGHIVNNDWFFPDIDFSNK